MCICSKSFYAITLLCIGDLETSISGKLGIDRTSIGDDVTVGKVGITIKSTNDIFF